MSHMFNYIDNKQIYYSIAQAHNKKLLVFGKKHIHMHFLYNNTVFRVPLLIGRKATADQVKVSMT